MTHSIRVQVHYSVRHTSENDASLDAPTREQLAQSRDFRGHIPSVVLALHQVGSSFELGDPSDGAAPWSEAHYAQGAQKLAEAMNAAAGASGYGLTLSQMDHREVDGRWVDSDEGESAVFSLTQDGRPYEHSVHSGHDRDASTGSFYVSMERAS